MVRYTGPAPACARGEGPATLTRHGTGFALAPTDGSVVIDGTVAPDGTLSGTLALRPAKLPGGKAPTPQAITVSGHADAVSATVAYTAPGCSATLTLARVHPSLL